MQWRQTIVCLTRVVVSPQIFMRSKSSLSPRRPPPSVPVVVKLLGSYKTWFRPLGLAVRAKCLFHFRFHPVHRQRTEAQHTQRSTFISDYTRLKSRTDKSWHMVVFVLGCQEGLKKGSETSAYFTTSCGKQLFSLMNYKKVHKVWWYSLSDLFGWGDEAGLGRVQPNCWNWTVHGSEGGAHTHLYGLMRGHGQIYLERESTDMRLEFRTQAFLLSQIFLLLLHISERFLWV